jgi:3'-phosphoadenosine 5'-phosphosulfate (PAPS) 3'-phosphatase
MWQQIGVGTMRFDKVNKHVRKVNGIGFGNHQDWRLPTLDEAASLLVSQNLGNSFYISHIFSDGMVSIWTADTKGSRAVWVVNPLDGHAHPCLPGLNRLVRLCRAAGR